MITRNMLRAIALATTCLAALPAFADDFSVDETPAAAPGGASATPALTNRIELGIIGVGGVNPNQAGRYTGFNTNGVSLGVTDLHIGGGSPWDSGSTRYYELNGNNLIYQTGNVLGTGLTRSSPFTGAIHNDLVNSGDINFKAGDQGSWGVGFDYHSITYTGNVIDSLYTVNGPIATLNNGLAPWGGATSTRAGTTSFTAAALAATGAMQPVQTGVQRDVLSGNFKYQTGYWTFTGDVTHEEKHGSMEESFDGPYGGTAFALPINFQTDRYNVAAAYYQRNYQAVLQYSYSHFEDNNLFVNLPYPTSNTSAPYQRSAAYSLPPSNDAHYLTLMLADNDLIPRTRLNLNARVGLELQNDNFAPNTADPDAQSASSFGLNPQTLQGTTSASPNMIAEVYQLKVSANSKPLPNVDTRFYYGLDARDVSLNQYKVNTSGTGGSSDSSLNSFQYVVPQTWLKQNAGAEFGYLALPASDTRLSLGYRFDDTERTNAQVGHSTTSTASAAITSKFGADITGKLSFDVADRSGAINYITAWANLAGSASGQTYSGAYYQAPMTSEAVTLRADYSPAGNLSGGVFLQFKNENYHYGDVSAVGTATATTVPLDGEGGGVKQDYALSIGPDVNYRPMPGVDLHFFYTYELLFYNNIGNGACSDAATAATAACAGTVGYFQNKDTSSTHTVGASIDWKVNDKLRLRGDYTISYGSVMFGEFNGVFIANPTASYQNVTNYPDINTLMNSVKLTGSYQLMPNVELAAQVAYTSLRNNDWNDTANAIQTAGAATISILTPGYGSPNYNVVSVFGGASIKF